jgi:hypothetical protein
MTGRALKLRLIATIGLVVIVLIISLIEYVSKTSASNTYVGGNATLFALLAAAYLAFCFQQRGKFIDEIRKWWCEIVGAKSAFFIYCDKGAPTADDFFDAFYKLSTAMDTLRLIYCNVDRTNLNRKGYYPFEQVRDIIDVARSVRPNVKPSDADRLQAKQAINLIFQSLRHAIQSEANATAPDDPTLYDSPYRVAYLNEIKEHIGLDVEEIRQSNKNEDYASRREKIVPRQRK